jgi:hypothetical protein
MRHSALLMMTGPMTGASSLCSLAHRQACDAFQELMRCRKRAYGRRASSSTARIAA